MKVKIQKWGNSQGIRIPKTILDDVGLKEDEIVDLIVDDKIIMVKKSVDDKEILIEDLFKDYDGDYKPTEIDWGKPVGDEVW